MTSLYICNGVSPFNVMTRSLFATLKFTTLIILAVFLASCSDTPIRTEAEYIDVATEAHASGNSRLALLELSIGIRNFPQNADLQQLRGKVFLDLEDGSAAEIAFNKAVSLGFNRDFLKHDLAQSWLYQRNPAKVIENLEKDIAEGSKDPLIYEIVGRAYIASRDRSNPTLFMKNMNQAEAYIEQAYALSPNNTRVLITKAWLPAMMGNIDEALEWLNKADLIVKDQRQNLAMQGELLIRQNKIDQAREIYERLVKKFRQYPQYKLELGFTYILSHDFAKAREWVEPVAKQYPDQLRSQYLLSNISLMEKEYDDAKELSDAILVNSPDHLEAVIINGASSYFLGDFENANQKLALFYNRTGSIPALKLLVATKLKLNENFTAAKLLEDAGQTIEEQTDTELLNLVALASAKVGKADAALEAYQKLVKQQPETSTYQSNLAMIQIAQGNYEEGFDNLEKALKKQDFEKESGQYLYTLATKALQVRQYDTAAIYIEQYKKIAPNNYKPWTMSAVLQTILKNNDAVRQDFEKAMEIAPDVAEVKARYAIFEKIQGNQDKAQSLAAQALKLDPSDIGAGKLLLEELVKDKKFEQIKDIVDNAVQNAAAPAFSKMIFADYYTLLGRPQETLTILAALPEPVKASASYQLISGKAYLRNGQAQSSVNMLEPFSLNNPNNIQALKYLMQGYVLTGNQEKYQSTLEKIDGLTPNDYGNQIDLAKLYISTGKFDLAEKILNNLKTENEQQALQRNIIRSTMETSRENIKAALAILTSLYKDYPENGGVSMLYSRNLANDGQVDKAITVSKSWSGQNPDNLDVKLFLGDLYMRKADNENAISQYEAIIASEKKAPKRVELHAHNNLAMIYMTKNEGQKAIAHAQKAFDMAPNNPSVVDTFAQILMKQGQAEKAVDHFNQALALLPSNDRKNRSLFTLGKARALIESGQKERARNILNRLIKDDPDFPKIDVAKQLLSEI
ncbi:MAG: PEP-CTERM system TPR-repeat protein PrsT [Emcibacter sp.]|nr:PEP-CTERM system TPR-repeat protein PrsT [Emcibacter sp.]